MENGPPLFLAPMAGVTDYPFRFLAQYFGADYVVTEMVSAHGLVQNNRRTWDLLVGLFEGGTSDCFVQLFGDSPKILRRAADCLRTEGVRPVGVDINMGCPVPKVVKSGAGAALMCDPERAAEMIAEVRTSLKSWCEVTVKIRSGWSEATINAAPFAQAMAYAGAQMIAVHGRPRSAFYRGRANWDVIRQVVDAVQVPVVGNGDVNHGDDARCLRERSGCAGIMIGRAALGQPWVFREIKAAFSDVKSVRMPAPGERLAIALYHLELTVRLKGDRRGTAFMRKHMGWYTHGLPEARLLRVAIHQSATLAETRATVQTYAKQHGFSIASRDVDEMKKRLPDFLGR